MPEKPLGWVEGQVSVQREMEGCHQCLSTQKCNLDEDSNSESTFSGDVMNLKLTYKPCNTVWTWQLRRQHLKAIGFSLNPPASLRQPRSARSCWPTKLRLSCLNPRKQHKHLEKSFRPRRRRSGNFQRKKNPRHKAPLACVPTGLSVASRTVIKVKLVFQRKHAG